MAQALIASPKKDLKNVSCKISARAVWNDPGEWIETKESFNLLAYSHMIENFEPDDPSSDENSDHIHVHFDINGKTCDSKPWHVKITIDNGKNEKQFKGIKFVYIWFVLNCLMKNICYD